jgi:hypothetical protein
MLTDDPDKVSFPLGLTGIVQSNPWVSLKQCFLETVEAKWPGISSQF